MKAMEKVTISSITGARGSYKLLADRAAVTEASHEEWVEGGEKLLVKLRVADKASAVVDQLMQNGMDHHLLVKEGDWVEVLKMICKFWDIERVQLFK